MAGKPKQLTQVTQKALTDAAEVGLTHWAPVGITGFAWATDEHRRYHAIHSTTRGGARQSRHACGLLRQAIDQRAAKLIGKAFYQCTGISPEYDRERELMRLQLLVDSPIWQCADDGPVVIHPAIAEAAVAAIQLAVSQ